MQYLAAGEALKELFCHTPGIKDRTFDSSGFSAMGTLISAFTVPHGEQSGRRIRGEKNDVECTRKAEIILVEFLTVSETCKAIF